MCALPRWVAAALAVAGLLCSACSSSSAGPSVPTIQPARTFKLSGFQPTGQVRARQPVTVAFTIRQPDGAPLTDYRVGAGPHTGVHVIFVRSDLETIIHRHPPVGPHGRITDTVTFPEPGMYRLVVDAYPNVAGPQRNFQLFGKIDVAGAFHRAALPPFKSTVQVGGYRFHVQGEPRLKAIQAGFVLADERAALLAFAKPSRIQP